MKILLIDDDPASIEETKNKCEKEEDLEVDLFLNPKEALKEIKKQRYDAIISDYQMPGMNGLEILKEIRDLGIATPFIMLTGKGEEEVAMKALNLGADKYYKKDHDHSQCKKLIQDIREAVEEKRNTQDHYIKIFEKYPHPILQANNEGEILALNKSMAEKHQTSIKDTIGTKIEKLYPETEQEILSVGKEALKENQVEIIPIHNDYEEAIILPITESDEGIFQLIAKPTLPDEPEGNVEIENLDDIKKASNKQEACKTGLKIIGNLVDLDLGMIDLIGVEKPFIISKTPISVAIDSEEQKEESIVKEMQEIRELEIEEENFKSAVTMPIGKNGVIQITSTKPNAFSEKDIKIINKILEQINLYIEREN